MARRLTDQQRRRIAMQQTRKREAAGRAVGRLDESSLGAEEETLVIAHYGYQLDVERASDGQVFRCHLRTNLQPLVTGDRVVVRLPQDGNPSANGVVVAGCERRSLLSRPDSRGLLRPIAANIDAMLVTFAPKPEPSPFLLDRYLVAADLHGIEPVMLFNKSDLLDDSNRDDMEALLHMYRSIGYTVLTVSAVTGDGLQPLTDYLHNKTAVIVGQSGVGKSSLITNLLPGVTIATGELSEGTDKGKHTTTTARLYHLPQGGHLIDSPGIREFDLHHISSDDVLSHFVDLREYAYHCRFRDCRHQQEPGCALLAAEADGRVFPQRMASYRNIVASLAEPV